MTELRKSTESISASASESTVDAVTQRDDRNSQSSVRVYWNGSDVWYRSVPTIAQYLNGGIAWFTVKRYSSSYGNEIVSGNVAFFPVNAGEQVYDDLKYPTSAVTWNPSAQSLTSDQRAVYAPGQISPPAPNVTSSPDYSSGYINVTPDDMYNNRNAGNQHRNVTFEYRCWREDSALITAYRGDGQTAKTNDVFSTPLSVKVTDSQGSMEATHNMLVWFSLDTPDQAEFDFSGDNQRYLGKNDAIPCGWVYVWCKNGIATCPRIKSKAAGDVKISAGCVFSSEEYLFVLHVDEDGAPESAPWYCDTGRADHQDTIAGNPFPDRIVAKAITKSHLPATTGKVKFDIYEGPVEDETANISFASGQEAIVEVDDDGGGTATAPAMVTKTSEYGPAGYAVGNVFASPSTYRTQDPRTDTSGRIAKFTLRVWSGKVAAMTIAQGDKQQQAAGLTFDQRLKVKVLGKDSSAVANLAVTFALINSPAEFIQGDTVPLLSWTPTSVVVATDGDGYATAPLIRTTANKVGSIFVAASSAVTPNTQNFSLTSVIPQGAAVGLQKENGDQQDQHINELFPFPLSVLASAKDGPAQTGQITFTSVADGASGAFIAKGTSQQSPTSVANVSDGSAVTPDALMAISVSNAKQSYGSFTVKATAPYSTLPTTFSQRVWRNKNAVLTPQGDGNPADNQALEGFPFKSPVTVRVTDPSGNIVNDLLVTFTIDGSATFRYDDLSGHQGTDMAAMVYTRDGLATSPDIIAGAKAGTVTITADATVAVKPVEFQLEVLEAATAPNFTYPLSGDKQDQLPGGSFAFPLVVSTKTIDGQAATTGDVYWEIAPDTATASFAGVSGLKTTTKVVNGVATSPPIVAGKSYDDDHGTLTVYAYPTSYTGDPKNDTIKEQVTAFTLRVWPEDFIHLVPGSDHQKANKGEDFADPLTVTVQDTHLAGAPVTDYLVTFKITNGPATFDPDDPNADYVSMTSDNKTAVVRSNFIGIATAPTLQAGMEAGTVTVVVSDPLSNHASYSDLTVIDPLPKVYILTALTTTLSIPVNSSNNASFQLKQLNGSGASVAGKNITFTLKNDTRSQASFSPAALETETSHVTDGGGLVTVKIWGMDIPGNALLYASQEQANPDPTIPVAVQVFSN
ncbi:hypothetical protein [Bordetella sp. LUAb4]|uniref:hypothetical protein n=1 Tax=Bordetella sp. LUAb4 TaxID=2843195 RepID=UPI001E50B30E|nr:hypothetical protein [Bordetella sp. LUAb4]